MATTGTATLDFGAFPGASDASVAVTGQASIVAGSLVEAWIRPVASTDHTADEHMIETIKVYAGNIVAGTGFTIYGFNTNQLNEPLVEKPSGSYWNQAGTTMVVKVASPGIITDPGGNGTRLYGTWTIAWVWN